MHKSTRNKTGRITNRNNTERRTKSDLHTKTARRTKEKVEKTSPRKTKKIRKTKNNDSLYYIGGAVAVFVIIIFSAYIFSSPTPQRTTNKTINYTIDDAKKIIVQGKNLLSKRDFREAEKVLKRSKEILEELKKFYIDDASKSQQIESLQQEANQSYYQAYKNSTIK